MKKITFFFFINLLIAGTITATQRITIITDSKDPELIEKVRINNEIMKKIEDENNKIMRKAQDEVLTLWRSLQNEELVVKEVDLKKEKVIQHFNELILTVKDKSSDVDVANEINHAFSAFEGYDYYLPKKLISDDLSNRLRNKVRGLEIAKNGDTH